MILVTHLASSTRVTDLASSTLRLSPHLEPPRPPVYLTVESACIYLMAGAFVAFNG